MSMTDDTQENDKCGLEEEIETLRSIYVNEINIENNDVDRPVRLSIDLTPATADNLDEQYVRMTLIFNLTEEYPDDVPKIDIKNPRGLSSETLTSITQELHSIAEDKKGNAMLFALIEAAKEHLTTGNRPSGECAICLYGFSEEDVFTKTECYHYFHSHCLARYSQHIVEDKDEDVTAQDKVPDKQLLCPMCRIPIEFQGSGSEFPPPSLADEFSFAVNEEMEKLQKELAELYQKQIEKGGIIDLEAEKNKYLLEISNIPTVVSNNEKATSSSSQSPMSESPKHGALPKESDRSPESAQSTNDNNEQESDTGAEKKSLRDNDKRSNNYVRLNRNNRWSDIRQESSRYKNERYERRPYRNNNRRKDEDIVQDDVSEKQKDAECEKDSSANKDNNEPDADSCQVSEKTTAKPRRTDNDSRDWKYDRFPNRRRNDGYRENRDNRNYRNYDYRGNYRRPYNNYNYGRSYYDREQNVKPQQDRYERRNSKENESEIPPRDHAGTRNGDMGNGRRFGRGGRYGNNDYGRRNGYSTRGRRDAHRSRDEVDESRESNNGANNEAVDGSEVPRENEIKSGDVKIQDSNEEGASGGYLRGRNYRGRNRRNAPRYSNKCRDGDDRDSSKEGDRRNDVGEDSAKNRGVENRRNTQRYNDIRNDNVEDGDSSKEGDRGKDASKDSGKNRRENRRRNGDLGNRDDRNYVEQRSDDYRRNARKYDEVRNDDIDSCKEGSGLNDADKDSGKDARGVKSKRNVQRRHENRNGDVENADDERNYVERRNGDYRRNPRKYNEGRNGDVKERDSRKEELDDGGQSRVEDRSSTLKHQNSRSSEAEAREVRNEGRDFGDNGTNSTRRYGNRNGHRDFGGRNDNSQYEKRHGYRYNRPHYSNEADGATTKLQHRVNAIIPEPQDLLSVAGKIAELDINVPSSNLVMPPPGFADPAKKVVYGLSAANPPPGFQQR